MQLRFEHKTLIITRPSVLYTLLMYWFQVLTSLQIWGNKPPNSFEQNLQRKSVCCENFLWCLSLYFLKIFFAFSMIVIACSLIFFALAWCEWTLRCYCDSAVIAFEEIVFMTIFFHSRKINSNVTYIHGTCNKMVNNSLQTPWLLQNICLKRKLSKNKRTRDYLKVGENERLFHCKQKSSIFSLNFYYE